MTAFSRDSGNVLGIERMEFSDVFSDDETVTVGDLLGNGFIWEYTDAEMFPSFLAKSPVSVDSASDFEDVPRDECDQYVPEITDFRDWRWLMHTANEEYVQRNTAY